MSDTKPTRNTPTLSLSQFHAEVEKRGNRHCGFRCPMCGNVATPDDFIARGANGERALMQCIGRLDNPMPRPVEGKTPCDWTAGGLFTCLGKGIVVVFEDGQEKDVFNFAVDPIEVQG